MKVGHLGRRHRWIRASLWVGLWLLCGSGLGSQAWARDVRLAMLIANQDGWLGDPWLNYVIKGDLRPMERQLRSIGFEVIILENQGADAVRHAFVQLRERLLQAPKVSTFVFYYTGHADQQYFHMGAKGKQPFGYDEFRKIFYNLKIARRVAIIDACHSGEIVNIFGSEKRFRTLRKRGIPKGVRAQRTANLIRRLRPSQGHEKGLRVIGSSRFLSWEIRKYKASVFTYHLLRGLRGKADTNQDGRISLDELFDFTRQQVFKDTGQRPQQYKQVIVGEPYAFAPAYRSRLHISAEVLGKLKIAVANFVWYKHKRKREAMNLAIVDGQGTAYLQKKKRCFQQPLRLPKGGEGVLKAELWRKIPCRQMRRIAKGGVVLDAQTRPIPRTERWLTIALQAGYAYLGEPTFRLHNGHVHLNVRLQHLGFGVSFASGTPDSKGFQLSRLLLHGELGWRRDLHNIDIFVGLQLHAGFTFQLHPQYSVGMALSAGVGGCFDVSWWWTPWLGGRIGAKVGFDYTPIYGSSGISINAQFLTGIVIAFSRGISS